MTARCAYRKRSPVDELENEDPSELSGASSVHDGPSMSEEAEEAASSATTAELGTDEPISAATGPAEQPAQPPISADDDEAGTLRGHPQTPRTCPKRHGLSELPVEYGAAHDKTLCDQCLTYFDPSTAVTVFGCRECNFDLCRECYQTPIVQYHGTPQMILKVTAINQRGEEEIFHLEARKDETVGRVKDRIGESFPNIFPYADRLHMIVGGRRLADAVPLRNVNLTHRGPVLTPLENPRSMETSTSKITVVARKSLPKRVLFDNMPRKFDDKIPWSGKSGSDCYAFCFEVRPIPQFPCI